MRRGLENNHSRLETRVVSSLSREVMVDPNSSSVLSQSISKSGLELVTGSHIYYLFVVDLHLTMVKQHSLWDMSSLNFIETCCGLKTWSMFGNAPCVLERMSALQLLVPYLMCAH